VQIQPGIEEGTAMRIPGYGMPSPVPGGVAGDAYIVVRTAVDARFVRRGADLWHLEEVTVPEAVLGTTRTVPALDGDVPVRIPPGTQPGTVLRVAGRGLPRPGGTGRGDLHVSVAVRIPDQLDDHERRLYEELFAAATSDAGQ
jgi:molecular chaperone DnaJ